MSELAVVVVPVSGPEVEPVTGAFVSGSKFSGSHRDVTTMTAVRFQSPMPQLGESVVVAARIFTCTADLIDGGDEADATGRCHRDVAGVRVTGDVSSMPELDEGGEVASAEEFNVTTGIDRDRPSASRRKESSGNCPGHGVAKSFTILAGPHPGAVATVTELGEACIRSIDRIAPAEEDPPIGGHVDGTGVFPAGLIPAMPEEGITEVVVAVRAVRGDSAHGAELETTAALHDDVSLDVSKTPPAPMTELHIGIVTTAPESAEV